MKAKKFLLVLLLLALSSCHAFAPSTFRRGLSVGQRSLTRKSVAMNLFFKNRIPFKRKTMFHLPVDRVKFDNRPRGQEAAAIRVFHWFQRLLVQRGAFNSRNPLVRVPLFFVYWADILWAGLDKEYYVKRRALFGPNYISAASLVVSKFDKDANVVDAIDTRLLSIPQKRRFYLGSTIMNPNHLPKEKCPLRPSEDRNISPLHVSDRGVGETEEGQLDHDDIRDAMMKNFVGGNRLEDAEARAADPTGQALVKECAQEMKGAYDKETLSPILNSFLLKYYHYILFDLPPSECPVELLNDTYYKDLKYILYLYGPAWLFSGLLRPKLKPGDTKKNLDAVSEYYAKSPVMKEFVPTPEGKNAMSPEGFIDLAKMLLGVAALQGTKALAITSLTQMPKGHAEKVANDPEELEKAVMECGRLDTPVTGAHCIVNEPDGITTEIGRKSLTFPRDTIIFQAFTLANTDEDRFESPYVFEPNRRGMPELTTSFNSVGEDSGDSPRICPGRGLAVQCVCDLITAKVEAEKLV